MYATFSQRPIIPRPPDPPIFRNNLPWHQESAQLHQQNLFMPPKPHVIPPPPQPLQSKQQRPLFPFSNSSWVQR